MVSKSQGNLGDIRARVLKEMKVSAKLRRYLCDMEIGAKATLYYRRRGD